MFVAAPVDELMDLLDDSAPPVESGNDEENQKTISETETEKWRNCD